MPTLSACRQMSTRRLSPAPPQPLTDLMLFDTESPNRKRAVRVIFSFLAVLMGAGLVLFGVGSAVGGNGILSGLSKDSSNSGSDALVQTQKKAAKAAAANPKSLTAAHAVAAASATLALNEAFNQTTGALNKGKKPLVTQADTAWTNYLALKPASFDPTIATQMVQIYATSGDYTSALRAQETRIASRTPNVSDYALLAELAIVTENKSEANLARKKALALATTASQRKQINAQLDSIQKQVTASTVKASASGTAGSTG